MKAGKTLISALFDESQTHVPTISLYAGTFDSQECHEHREK